MFVNNEKLPWDIFLNSKFFAKHIFNQETTFKFYYLIEMINFILRILITQVTMGHDDGFHLPASQS